MSRALRLTTRQRLVVSLVASGYTDQEIAERLGITAGTVKNHVLLIRQRVGARNRAHLAALIATAGLWEPSDFPPAEQ